MQHLPLATAQLRVIQNRNIVNADVMTLLREIRRFHRVLNNCWQVLDRMPPEPPNSRSTYLSDS
ncbi:hypothetical protein [Pollutimonas bauzanensis]|uniref:hypothetical protein n=1 Tax=Pollutimonas bauzanensis TaxID=658167 RepID=UPI001160C33B|nr:hypothetical protein [Pollutimonas bauzanensis]